MRDGNGRDVLDARSHKVDTSFSHPECESEVPFDAVCVLPTGESIESRPAFRVVAKEDVLSCDSLCPRISIQSYHKACTMRTSGSIELAVRLSYSPYSRLHLRVDSSF
jgi:hypothetical protein